MRQRSLCNPSQDVRNEPANRSGTSGTSGKTTPNCRKTVAGRVAPPSPLSGPGTIPAMFMWAVLSATGTRNGEGKWPRYSVTPNRPPTARSRQRCSAEFPRALPAQDSETIFVRAAGRRHSNKMYPCLVAHQPPPPPARPMCTSSAHWDPAAKAHVSDQSHLRSLANPLEDAHTGTRLKPKFNESRRGRKGKGGGGLGDRSLYRASELMQMVVGSGLGCRRQE